MYKALLLSLIMVFSCTYSITANAVIICFPSGICLDIGDIGIHP